MIPRRFVLIGASLIAAHAVSSCKAQPDAEEVRPEPHPPRSVSAGVSPKAHQKAATREPAKNPVQSEMLLLHDATRAWVTAVANNTLSTIPVGIRKVHRAGMVTEAALKKGTYKPPRNGDGLEAFIKQDEAFHDELVKLLEAAKADDLPAATKQLGVVLEGCTACHMKYRF